MGSLPALTPFYRDGGAEEADSGNHAPTRHDATVQRNRFNAAHYPRSGQHREKRRCASVGRGKDASSTAGPGQACGPTPCQVR
jgi:hypothetical protein